MILAALVARPSYPRRRLLHGTCRLFLAASPPGDSTNGDKEDSGDRSIQEDTIRSANADPDDDYDVDCKLGMRIQYQRQEYEWGFMRWWRGYTVDLNHDFAGWDRHESRWRHLRLWTPPSILSSQTFRRLIFPDLLVIGGTASLLVWYNATVVPWGEGEEEVVNFILQPGFNLLLHHDQLTLPLAPFTLSTFALSMLITHRLSQSHGRYTEARKFWGGIINTTRSLAVRMLAWRPGHSEDRDMFLRLVRTFPLTLRYHLTVDGNNPDIRLFDQPPKVPGPRAPSEIEADKSVALRGELRTQLWDISDRDQREMMEQIVGAPHRPLFVLNELSRLNAKLSTEYYKQARAGDYSTASAGAGDASAPSSSASFAPRPFDSVTAAQVDKDIVSLTDYLGGCERIIRTPLYTPLTRHTARFVFLYCTMLPLALYPVVGPTGTIPVSLGIAYLMMGMEDIGSRRVAVARECIHAALSGQLPFPACGFCAGLSCA